MPEPVATLTIAITTRALFHLEDSHALFEREGIAAKALEFAILTATRSGEVRGARWDEPIFLG